MVYLFTHTHTTVDTDIAVKKYIIQGIASLINKVAALGWENLTVPHAIKKMGYSRKNPNTTVQEQGLRTWNFQGYMEERACENFKVQLKKKWNCQGGSRKTNVEVPWFLFFDVGISKEV